MPWEITSSKPRGSAAWCDTEDRRAASTRALHGHAAATRRAGASACASVPALLLCRAMDLPSFLAVARRVDASVPNFAARCVLAERIEQDHLIDVGALELTQLAPDRFG